MTKTVIEKVASSSSEVAVFKVGGTLGYHENKTLQRFFEECKKRDICKIILDFSDLRSVGGGCARIIQETASVDSVVLAIVGASPTVLKFLQNQTENDCLIYAANVEEAIATINFNPDPSEFESRAGIGYSEPAEKSSSGDEREWKSQRNPEPAPPRETQERNGTSADQESSDELSAVVKEVDELLSSPPPARPESVPEEPQAPRAVPADVSESGGDPPHVILLGHESGSDSPAAATPNPSPAPAPAATRESDLAQEIRALKKKVVHYNTLLSISSDFNRLDDRASIIDAFLLTTIAQIGVESAAFFKMTNSSFVYTSAKGIDLDGTKVPIIDVPREVLENWKATADDYTIDQLPFDRPVREQLAQYGFLYGVPFIIQGGIRGMFFLGKPIRQSLDSDWTDFFKVLMNQAAISYLNTSRLEEESERTLGLVQTLISLIEENTVGKGTISQVTNYTHAVALRMQYPKEHIKDLMFGAVLRDIGMIKVSDLIVRSPRELVHEEWEIIKRHPIDGAAMLEKMKFSAHTRDIVSSHHERFNGEGYPQALEGHGIPLGARIISVVESYIAMLHDRPIRPALSKEEALQTLRENWGLRYDPDVVQAFVEIVEREINSGEKVLYKNNEIFSL